MEVQEKNEKIPIYHKLILTIPEAAEYSHIGQNRIADMMSSAMCPFVLHVGNRKLIKRKEFEEYLSSRKYV